MILSPPLLATPLNNEMPQTFFSVMYSRVNITHISSCLFAGHQFSDK